MEISKSQLSDKDVWAAHFQSAGRGQQGNVWCSDAGSNLTFSIYLKPRQIRACDQFSLSQSVSLGICLYLNSRGVDANIKWPNDIYVGNNKICGILIEHTVSGSCIKDTIAGIGLNINQRVFPPEIPNPTSLSLETGRDYDVRSELEPLLEFIFEEVDSIGPQTEQDYLQRLYLKDVRHTFTVAATGEKLDGRITGIASDGRLEICDPQGASHLFAFKEIIY